MDRRSELLNTYETSNGPAVMRYLRSHSCHKFQGRNLFWPLGFDSLDEYLTSCRLFHTHHHRISSSVPETIANL